MKEIRGKNYAYFIIATQSVVHGPEALGSPGGSLEFQSHGPFPKTTGSKSELSHESAGLGGHWKQRIKFGVNPLTITHTPLRDLCFLSL